MDWHTSVYHLGEQDWISDSETRRAIHRRDKYKCLRCGSKNNLTIHHIIPRAEGGGDDFSNLMLLCSKCHDYIECTNLRTKKSIINEPDENDDLIRRVDEPPENDWHLWVYGGYRNPNL